MIESRLLRGGASVVVGAAVLAALTSCSLLGGSTPAATTAVSPRPSATEVIDPSIPSDSPSADATAAGPTPAVSASASASTVAATPADSRKQVVPFITSAEWDPKAKQLDVSGIVPSVLEQGGTCTTVATMGGATKTVTSAAVPASSYTGCETVSMSGLADGTWSVRIAYSSAKSAGQSAERQVTVG